MTDLERRYTPRETLEFRAKKGTAGVLVGYAAKYDTMSRNLGGFVETIAPGAFNKSLSDGVDVLARYNHDDAGLLGRTSSGTVRLSNDEVGLRYEVDLPDTSVGRDVAVLAARGDIYQSSFAFYTHDDNWTQTEQGYPLRTLRAVELVDVAPVNSPAYLDTSVGLRSFAKAHGMSFEDVQKAAASNRLRAMSIQPPIIDPEIPDPMSLPDSETCPLCIALDHEDTGGKCACAPGCGCNCECCPQCSMTVAGADDSPRSSATHGVEIPQVDNHGLVVVRKRLLELKLRRNP